MKFRKTFSWITPMCPKKICAALPVVALTSVLFAAAPSALAVPMGTQWTNFNQPGVDMTNIKNQRPYQYDAYGSWWDDGTGMKFYYSSASAGENHLDNRPGHGFIPETEPLLYHFDQSFLSKASYSATLRVMEAFDLWELEINGTFGTRKPGLSLGFSWDWVPSTSPAQINISWAERGAYPAWVVPHTGGGDTSQLDLTFVSNYCQKKINSDGTCPDAAWVATNFYDGTDTPVFDSSGNKIVYDMFSTAIHELGHLIGLDDLYSIYDFEFNGFPGYVMGTPYASGVDMNGRPFDENTWNPYYGRVIDFGSLQGAIDLYTVEVPPTFLTLLLGVLLLAAARVCHGRPRERR